MEIFFRILKVIIDILAYSSLCILIWTYFYVKHGAEIYLHYEKDEDDEDYTDDDTDDDNDNRPYDDITIV